MYSSFHTMMKSSRSLMRIKAATDASGNDNLFDHVLDDMM